MTSPAEDVYSLLDEGEEEDDEETDEEEDEARGRGRGGDGGCGGGRRGNNNRGRSEEDPLSGLDGGGISSALGDVDSNGILNIKKEVASPAVSTTFSNVSSPATIPDDSAFLTPGSNNASTINPPSSIGMCSSGGIAAGNNNEPLMPSKNGVPYFRGMGSGVGSGGGGVLGPTATGGCPGGRAVGSGEWQEESSEYTFAKALLDQAPHLNIQSPDLNHSSVLRLAQAYIALQQGLRSWSMGSDPLDCWPNFVDGGDVAVKTQQALSCFVLIVTAHGTIVYVSEAIDGLLGHDQINLVGRSVQTLLHPEELSVLATQFSLFAGSGHLSSSRSFYTRMLNVKRSSANRQRYELVHVIGHLQEVVLSASSDRTMGQKETWLMCACKVLTPLVEEEGSSALCKEWISHNELDGKIIYMDSRSCQMTGYLASEMTGMSPYCFIHSDDQEHVAFSHNQALISANGASSTYRMYTSSHDLIYIHTSMQLSRDKVTNRPKALFCIHQVLEEKKGKEQIYNSWHEIMWSKVDPAKKFTMADIERTVKTLEQGGVASRIIPSKGGMMNSHLTDSCTSDGTDLLRRKISQFLVVPAPSMENYNRPTRGRGRGGGYRGRNTPYQRHNHQKQPALHRQNSYSPVSPYNSLRDVWSNSQTHPQHLPQQQQQQQHPHLQHHHQQQQQPKMYRRHNSQPCQQPMMSPPAGRSPYHHQMSVPSPAICPSPLSAGGSTPRSSSPVSFVDLLCDEAGPHSVPPDMHHTFDSELMSLKKPMMPGTRGRGRGRARGRPRGSGRGTRGGGRGVGRPRGSRGGRGRGRGRGQSSQMAQMREYASAMKRSVSLDTSAPYSMPSDNGQQQQTMMSSHAGMMGDQLNAGMNDPSLHSIPSVIDNDNGFQSGNTGGPGSFTRMLSEDSSSMFGRHSQDGLDFLDGSMKNYDMRRVPSLEMLSPGSSSSQDCSIPNSHKFKGKSPSLRGSLKRPYMPNPDFFPVGVYETPKHIKTLQLENENDPLGASLIDLDNKPVVDTNICVKPEGGNIKGVFQHSASFPAPSGSNSNSSSQGGGGGGTKSDVEHSILGNLLKGSGGRGSLTSPGSKSPIHAGPLDPGGEFPPATKQSANGTMRKNLWQGGSGSGGTIGSNLPLMPDKRGVGAAAASNLTVDCSSPFSTTSSMGPSTPKGGGTPDFIGGIDMNNSQQAAAMFDSHSAGSSETMRSNSVAELHMFSDQLRQKHKSLERSFVSQEHLLSHLESNMQQTVHGTDPESLYARLSARLDVIKANKAKQEEELRMIKAKLESQVQQYKVNSQAQQAPPVPSQPLQHQPQFQPHQQLPLKQTTQFSEFHQQQQPAVPAILQPVVPPPAPAPPHPSVNTNTVELQKTGHTSHTSSLNTPMPLNPRRMAIVPPIQRQMLEVDTSSSLSQSGSVDLKASQGLDSPAACIGSKPDSISPLGGGSDTGDSIQALKSSSQSSSQQLAPLGVPSSTSSALSLSSTTSLSSSGSFNPPSHPQASSYNLHHHHHHHHYHHHHPVPVLTCQQQQKQQDSLPVVPPCRQPQQQQQAIDFPPSATKLSLSSPYCPFDSSSTSTATSSMTPSSSSSSCIFSQTSLSISTSSLRTSLTSPIVCDTSPISVDESPSCASDTSSGYHSLSLSADSTGTTAGMGNQLSSVASSDPLSLMLTSKTSNLSACQSKIVMNSPELLTGTGQVYPPISN